MKVRSFSWTSDGSGDYSLAAINIDGVILRVVTNPGTTAPTDNYDVTFTDADGFDLFGGQGANRDATATESFCPGVPFSDGVTIGTMPVAHKGDCTLTIANAGDTKNGVVTIYYK